jgi:hypothetical protein
MPPRPARGRVDGGSKPAPATQQNNAPSLNLISGKSRSTGIIAHQHDHFASRAAQTTRRDGCASISGLLTGRIVTNHDHNSTAGREMFWI